MTDKLLTTLGATAPAQIVIRALLAENEALRGGGPADIFETELTAVMRLAADRLDASPDDELAIAVGVLARAMIAEFSS